MKRVLAAPASPLGMINSRYSPSPALSALSNDHFCISPCWEGGHIRGRMIDNPNHVVGPLPTVSLPAIHRNGRDVLAGDALLLAAQPRAGQEAGDV